MMEVLDQIANGVVSKDSMSTQVRAVPRRSADDRRRAEKAALQDIDAKTC